MPHANPSIQRLTNPISARMEIQTPALEKPGNGEIR